MNDLRIGLYDPARESSACGVGFITRKDGRQDHDVIVRGEHALCAIPHRGGMSSEGVGDGAGVSVDLSVRFFSALTGWPLEPGAFGVANLFMPTDPAYEPQAREIVRAALERQGLEVLLERLVPVDPSALRPAAVAYQLPIVQWVFVAPADRTRSDVDRAANAALLEIEQSGYERPELAGLYPLSLSARTQVLKGRLNAGEVVRYFTDLVDPRHEVRTLYFHTRFSTNTEPHPTMAQPFRMMAHNGELNTDRKNRLADDAGARARLRRIVRPPGQSDSSRLDQTLQSRVFDDGLDIVEAVVSLMPPAWENDHSLPAPIRDMLEFFSLYEEKNDGPAALIFSDGDVVGARLDRLGLRPLRTVETDDYLIVASEAGQVPLPADTVVHRGRIEAGGMLYLDHRTGQILRTREALAALAARRDYGALLGQARVALDALPAPAIARGTSTLGYDGDLSLHGRFVAYSHNQESFRFMMDPMLADGSERISAMGYGNAINALSDQEGGLAKYFSQRFAQVTNPPLDSIREADGMSMRVALGAKPDGTGASTGSGTRQIVIDSPILDHLEMVKLREQQVTPLQRFDLLYTPVPDAPDDNAAAMVAAMDLLCDQIEAFAREQGGIAVLTDRSISTTRAPLPLLLGLAAVNQRLISTGLRLRVSLIAESGQLPVLPPHRLCPRVRRRRGLLPDRAAAGGGEVPEPARTGGGEDRHRPRLRPLPQGGAEVAGQDDGPGRAVHRGELHRRRVLRAQLPRHPRPGAGPLLPAPGRAGRRGRVHPDRPGLDRLAHPRLRRGRGEPGAAARLVQGALRRCRALVRAHGGPRFRGHGRGTSDVRPGARGVIGPPAAHPRPARRRVRAERRRLPQRRVRGAHRRPDRRVRDHPGLPGLRGHHPGGALAAAVRAA